MKKSSDDYSGPTIFYTQQIISANQLASCLDIIEFRIRIMPVLEFCCKFRLSASDILDQIVKKINWFLIWHAIGRNLDVKIFIMLEQKLRTIKRAAMWIAALTGGVCGAILTIVGYLLDWGPGSGMHPPIWRIWLIALLSVSISAYIGELLVRKLARLILASFRPGLEIAMKFFLIMFVGCMASFIVSWEVAFLTGKITGAIEGLGWVPALFYTPLMSFIYGLPFCLGLAFVFAIFAFFYLKPFQTINGSN